MGFQATCMVVVAVVAVVMPAITNVLTSAACNAPSSPILEERTLISRDHNPTQTRTYPYRMHTYSKKTLLVETSDTPPSTVVISRTGTLFVCIFMKK